MTLRRSILVLLIITFVGIIGVTLTPPKHHNYSGYHVSNIKQLGTSHQIYLADYDNISPPAQSQVTYRSLVNPYIKNDSLFTEFDKTNRTDIRYNTNLSNVRLISLKDPSTEVLLHTPFHENPTLPPTKYLVTRVDSGTKVIKPTDWPTVLDALDHTFPRVSNDFYPPETIINIP